MAVGIVATLHVADGKQDEFEAGFAKMQEVVKAEEPGCQLYQLCRDKADNTVYRVMEIYADQAARDAHGRSDGFRAAAGAIGACMAGAPEIIEVDIVS